MNEKKTCPVCGGKMVVKSGEKGTYLVCGGCLYMKKIG